TLPEAKAEQLGLGLDLKGGMNVVLRVSLKDLIRKMANNTSDKTFNRALAMAVKQQATTSTSLITLFYQNWYKIKSPDDRLAPLFSSAFQDKIDFNTTDEEVIDVVSDEAKNAIRRTYRVLLNRIDKFGVAFPQINVDVNQGIITVALPGVHNPKRVRRYLQATAQLEFWETFQADESFV